MLQHIDCNASHTLYCYLIILILCCNAVLVHCAVNFGSSAVQHCAAVECSCRVITSTLHSVFLWIILYMYNVHDYTYMYISALHKARKLGAAPRYFSKCPAMRPALKIN